MQMRKMAHQITIGNVASTLTSLLLFVLVFVYCVSVKPANVLEQVKQERKDLAALVAEIRDLRAKMDSDNEKKLEQLVANGRQLQAISQSILNAIDRAAAKVVEEQNAELLKAE